MWCQRCCGCHCHCHQHWRWCAMCGCYQPWIHYHPAPITLTLPQPWLGPVKPPINTAVGVARELIRS